MHGYYDRVGRETKQSLLIISSLKVHLCGFTLGTVKRFVQVSGMIESRNYMLITTIAITRNTHRSTHAA